MHGVVGENAESSVATAGLSPNPAKIFTLYELNEMCRDKAWVVYAWARIYLNTRSTHSEAELIRAVAETSALNEVRQERALAEQEKARLA